MTSFFFVAHLAIATSDARDTDIVRLLKSEDAKIRWAALRELASQKQESFMAPIIEVIETEKNIYVSYEALRAFEAVAAHKSSSRAIPALLHLLQSRPKSSSEVIAIGWDRLRGPIDIYYGDQLLRSLSAIGPQGVPDFRRILESDPDWKRRAGVVLALRHMARKIRENGERDQRKASLFEISSALACSIKDGDERVKHLGVGALESLGEYAASSLPLLMELASNQKESKELRQSALKAISRIEER